MTLKQKLRRPSGDHPDANTSTAHESDKHQQPMECGSPVIAKHKSVARNEANETITLKSKVLTPPLLKTSVSNKTEVLKASFEPETASVPVEKLKVNFKLDTTITKEKTTTASDESCGPVECQEELASQEEESCISEPVILIAQNDPPKQKGRTRRVKKTEDVVVEDEKVVEVETHTIENSLPMEEKETKRPSVELEIVPKKKTRKVRKPADEKSDAVVATTSTASPRATRLQKPKESIRCSPASSAAQNSPRLEKTPSKRNLQDQISRNLQFAANNSSPVRKVFTPKVVFR